MSNPMLTVEIDGQTTEVSAGSTVMDAAMKLGVYVPHFCYHKKLSIAANCRMCLVEVQKAPKPLPACATPVTDGMKVFTHSPLAVQAQKGVMEFLLINHPLDCPICDQGGECQLQDLSVGYGGGVSRYHEAKRIVPYKDVGPLISMQEMSRCIHCTRCVRFGQEIAGVMELGMANRNMHSEIMTFVGRSVDSELSGNMIDVCPVGALTSKPFRYRARSWELKRRPSIAAHDALGSNLVAQVKHERIERILPQTNDAINECWLSDRDRFSYTAVDHPDRLLAPMVKQGGEWQPVSWATALDYLGHALGDIVKREGGDALAALVSPQATLEEMTLVRELMLGLGSRNWDFRLRQSSFASDGLCAGIPWLGIDIAEIAAQQSVLVLGAFLRKDHPLIAQRLRQAAKTGTAVMLLDCGDDDPLMPIFARHSVRPAELLSVLAALVLDVARRKGEVVDDAAITSLARSSPSTAALTAMAERLVSGGPCWIALGNVATHVAEAASLHALTDRLARLCGAHFGFLGEAANSVGGYVALPVSAGVNTRSLLDQPRSAYLLYGWEPEHDSFDAALTAAALSKAKTVAAFAAFAHPSLLAHADVLLPIALSYETSGTFINCEGRVQSFAAVAAAPGEARPGWKVLRVLANVLDLPGFADESSESIRARALDGHGETRIDRCTNHLTSAPTLALESPPSPPALQRLGRLPVYGADPLTRRASPLAQTRDGQRQQKAQLSPALAARLGVAEGDLLCLTAVGAATKLTLTATLEPALPDGCVGVAAHLALGGLYDAITVERVAA